MEFSREWVLDLNLTRGQHKPQEALSKGNGFVMSNGSFKDEMGAAAWIIEGHNPKN